MAGIGNQTKELTTKQARAIAMLLTAKDVQSAAKDAGVGERTLHTWLADPTFQAALKEAEGRTIQEAVRRLAGTSQSAIGVMLSLMEDTSIPASVRLRAAQSVLEQMVKLRQFADLEERIAALEAALEAEACTSAAGRR